MESTLTFADLYGGRRPGTTEANSIERDSAAASGEFSPMDTAKPAIFWVALVALVVVFRLLSKKVG